MNCDAYSTIDHEALKALFAFSKREDLRDEGDMTTCLLNETVPLLGNWKISARQAGTLSGIAILPELLEALCPKVALEWTIVSGDGTAITAGTTIAKLGGDRRQMLAAERTMLNFLQHLSGVATLTARFVAAVHGTGAKIYDTRKTLPGLRGLEKYAVRCGGGENHRAGLYDAVLIKDNHLAGIPQPRIASAVFEMLNRVGTLSTTPKFIEVECDYLEQLEELLKVVGIDVILLDNFSLPDLRAAVALRDRSGLRGKVSLEASGGITLETVRSVAETGVERIAVGAITHSAPALDLGLDAI